MQATKARWKLIGGIVLALGWVAGCDRDRAERAPPVGTTTPGTPRPEVEDIKDMPGWFYGKRVTLVGEVEGVLGPRAFKLDGEDSYPWQDEIPVVAKTPMMMAGTALGEDDDVIVTGVVRPGDRVALERELGWTIEPQLDMAIRGKPVLMAESIRRIGEYARWSATDPEQTTVGVLMVLTVADPAALAGQRVRFEAELVQRVGPKALWIGPNAASQILVAPADASMMQGIEVGERVTVTGTIEKMADPARARRELELPVTVSNATLEEQPLLIRASKLEVAPRDAS